MSKILFHLEEAHKNRTKDAQTSDEMYHGAVIKATYDVYERGKLMESGFKSLSEAKSWIDRNM
jgi:hypothetical protein